MAEFSKLNGQAVKDATARGNHDALVKEINELIDQINDSLEGFLPLIGGTLTGGLTINGATNGYSVNATGYVKGSWLQATSASNLSSSSDKICVLDSSGWVYYRTKEQLKSDLGMSEASGDTKVTQTKTTSGSSMPLLLAPAGQTATTTTTANFTNNIYAVPSTGRLYVTGSSNPLFGLQATGGTQFFLQALTDTLYLGPTSSKALAFTGSTGAISMPNNLTVAGTISEGGTALSDTYAPKKNNPNLTYYATDSGSATAGTWLGKVSDVTSLYDGLSVNYKVTVAGASTTTFNLNGLGAKTVYLHGTTKLTTNYEVGTIINMIYNSSTGAWYVADYDSNSYAYLRQYYTLTATDGEYPIIYSYTTATGTSSYKTAYGAVKGGFTFNPSTDMLSIGHVAIDGKTGGIAGKGETLLLYTEEGIGSINLSDDALNFDNWDEINLNGTVYINGSEVSTYSKATTGTLGLVKSAANRSTSISPTTGGTTSNRYYGVELDADGTMFVNVPWTSGSSSTPTMTSVAANTAVRYEDGLYMCIPESTGSSITIKPLYGNSISAKPTAFFIYNRVGSSNPFYIDYSTASGTLSRLSLTGYNGTSPGATPTISCSVAMRYVKIAGV